MNDPIKVIHVCTVGITVPRFLLPQCLYLKDQGIDISFVFSPGPEADILRKKGFSVKEIPIAREIHPVQDLQSVIEMARFFRATKPDIIHTHTSKAGLAGRMAAYLAKVPIVIHTVHGFPFDEGMSRTRAIFYQILERFGARLSTAMLSQSAEDVETARRLGIKPRLIEELVHIGNGIDLQLFSPECFSMESKLNMRRSLNIGQSTVVITTIARINRVKGYHDLINAVSMLPNCDWHLLCIGEDEGIQDNVMKQVADLGLRSRVTLMGPRTDIPEILSITDIYVLASYREGMPRSIIEAQAMAIPVVATNIRGSREIVIDNETGFLVPTHDPAAIRQSIQRLVDDSVLRKSFGVAGRQRVLQEFDEDKVCQRVWDIYRQLLSALMDKNGHWIINYNDLRLNIKYNYKKRI